MSQSIVNIRFYNVTIGKNVNLLHERKVRFKENDIFLSYSLYVFLTFILTVHGQQFLYNLIFATIVFIIEYNKINFIIYSWSSLANRITSIFNTKNNILMETLTLFL